MVTNLPHTPHSSQHWHECHTVNQRNLFNAVQSQGHFNPDPNTISRCQGHVNPDPLIQCNMAQLTVPILI